MKKTWNPNQFISLIGIQLWLGIGINFTFLPGPTLYHCNDTQYRPQKGNTGAESILYGMSPARDEYIRQGNFCYFLSRVIKDSMGKSPVLPFWPHKQHREKQTGLVLLPTDCHRVTVI